ncbi:MAG: hypothetical protein ACRDGE_07300 [Candidatus Limnocylindria bacterium]
MNEPSEIKGWLTGRVPDEWFTEAPEIVVDKDEILVVGRIPEVPVSEGTDPDAAREGAIKRFREETREARMRIAEEAQRKFGRHVSWGARSGDTGRLFTHLSVPVMTRLRIKERLLLDALVQAGVARSRSHALAWCVRLVAEHQGDWIEELKDAMSQLERVRGQGPKLH